MRRKISPADGWLGWGRPQQDPRGKDLARRRPGHMADKLGQHREPAAAVLFDRNIEVNFVIRLHQDCFGCCNLDFAWVCRHLGQNCPAF